MPKHWHFRFKGKISKKESGDFYTSGASAHMPDVNATSLLHLHNLSLPCHTMLKTSNSNFSWFSTLYWVGRDDDIAAIFSKFSHKTDNSFHCMSVPKTLSMIVFSLKKMDLKTKLTYNISILYFFVCACKQIKVLYA